MFSQRVGHANATHAQNDFLLQAIVGVAAIKVVGESAVPTRVSVDVRIQKVDGHDVAGAAHQVVAPGANGDGSVLNNNRGARSFFGAEVGGIPSLDFLRLGAGGVEVLLEVALAVKKRESDQGNAQI